MQESTESPEERGSALLAIGMLIAAAATLFLVSAREFWQLHFAFRIISNCIYSVKRKGYLDYEQATDQAFNAFYENHRFSEFSWLTVGGIIFGWIALAVLLVLILKRKPVASRT